MFTDFRVRNFKSLVDFKMELAPLTILIGLNGSGKTTILQAFDFTAQLMNGQIDSWLLNRNWAAADLYSKLSHRNAIFIGISIETKKTSSIIADSTIWMGGFDRKNLNNAKELAQTTTIGYSFENKILQIGETTTLPLLATKNNKYRIGDEPMQDIAFAYQGSILSQLRSEKIPPALLELRDSVRNIRSLELLSPHLMRQKARGDSDNIGLGGEKLSAFLSTVKGEQKEELIKLLKKFYPRLVDIKTSSIKGGWKRLAIVEEFDGKRIETEARHINDGLLRILAILAQNKIDNAMLIFDEIENGVNPELVEMLVKTLVQSKQQIIVTTHSPMILNYLDDETARKAVQFVYKTPEGHTRVRRFFDIPRINEKLAFIGAGEAFVDTDLVALEQECIALDATEPKKATTLPEFDIKPKARKKRS